MTTITLVEAKARHVEQCIAVYIIRRARAKSIPNQCLNMFLVEALEVGVADCKGLLDWLSECITREEVGGRRALAVSKNLDTVEAVETAVCLWNDVLELRRHLGVRLDVEISIVVVAVERELD